MRVSLGVDGGQGGGRGRERGQAGHGVFPAAPFQPCVGGDDASRTADFARVGGCAGDQFEPAGPPRDGPAEPLVLG